MGIQEDVETYWCGALNRRGVSGGIYVEWNKSVKRRKTVAKMVASWVVSDRES